MAPQVPSDPLPFFAAEHATQTPLHALLQHTPSKHCALAHSASREHGAPRASVVHAPEPSQVVDPEHSLSGSSPLAMAPQVPSDPLPFFAAEHATQAPLHALLQHTPSTQFPLWQFAFTLHADPSGRSAGWHVPPVQFPLWQSLPARH